MGRIGDLLTWLKGRQDDQAEAPGRPVDVPGSDGVPKPVSATKRAEMLDKFRETMPAEAVENFAAMFDQLNQGFRSIRIENGEVWANGEKITDPDEIARLIREFGPEVPPKPKD